jgi:hypothetical protein
MIAKYSNNKEILYSETQTMILMELHRVIMILIKFIISRFNKIILLLGLFQTHRQSKHILTISQ